MQNVWDTLSYRKQLLEEAELNVRKYLGIRKIIFCSRLKIHRKISLKKVTLKSVCLEM